RYAGTVSGFLVANRCAGRYLISVAFNMAQLGVITLVWYFQQNYDVGWTSIWWGLLEGPAMILIALSGWVIYRFRQTRALTLAQFFEQRYSKRFRVFAGLVAFLSGIINYGIFPGVAARYFMALCGLPETLDLGFASLPTLTTLMVGLMAIALLFVFLGGQIAVMVTDFLQGVFSNIVFLAVISFLLLTIPWGHFEDVLLGKVWQGQWVAESGVAPPAGQSLVHPFDLGGEAQFNVWYWVISVVVLFYGMRAWQGDQGYNAAAKSPHEARMANILNGWRFRVLMLITVVLPVAIRVLMHHPAYAGAAAVVQAGVDLQPTAALQSEARIPLGTLALLPAGMLGLMAAAMLGAFISTNDTYLHSWAAIFIQDVVLPFRKRPLGQRAHLWLLRAAILGVAAFAVWFSLSYEPNQYIAMFLALTGAIFVGGAGSAIIGGLYWKRGTTAGAWSAMIVGMSLSGFGIIMKQAFIGEALLQRQSDGSLGAVGGWLLAMHRSELLTGQVLTFVAIAAAASTYVLVSLLSCRRPFDLDKLLHRGAYAVAEDRVEEHEKSTWLTKLGFNREFSGRDQWVTWITIAWPLAWTLVFLAFTVYNLTVDVPPESWLSFWRGWTWFVLLSGTAIMIWFTIGGFRDLKEMFRLLRERRADERDDGRVEP
ncbi:MAG: sodium:solute symporter, partial [Planctomycetes bacterium]|nr:sodium:solute symporter [Planctomycetota bacterium]